MDPTAADRFAHDLLRASVLLTDLADDLLDAVGDREDPVQLVLLIAGSIATALDAVPEDDVEAARGVLAQALDAVLSDLERAVAHAPRPPRRRWRGGRRPSCR